MAPRRDPRRRRSQRLPPPLLEGEEALEGQDVLTECPGDQGLLLWKSLLNLYLWVSVPGEQRDRLFDPSAARRRREDLRGAELDRELVAPLGRLAGILDAGEEVSPMAVAGACREVAHWAESGGAIGTALHFMQAASLAVPDDADAACAVGKLARLRAEYGRAESWFWHSILIGRGSRDWSSYVRAHIGLSKVYLQRGAFPAARRSIARAERTAHRHGLTELQGWALHDRACIEIRGGRWSEAKRFVRLALEHYGADRLLVARLAHDVAYAWMTGGLHEPALVVLQSLDPEDFSPGDRLCLFSTLGRTAAEAGRTELYAEAWRRAERTIAEEEVREITAGALLEFAHGARSLGRREEALRIADEVLRLAVRHSEAKVRLEAEELRETLQETGGEAPSPSPEEEESSAAAVDLIVEDLLSSLHASASPGRG